MDNKVVTLITRGKKAMDHASGHYRQSRMLVSDHQITGTDRDGKPIYKIGTRKAMVKEAEYYQRHGITVNLSAREQTADGGITPRRIY